MIQNLSGSAGLNRGDFREDEVNISSGLIKFLKGTAMAKSWE